MPAWPSWRTSWSRRAWWTTSATRAARAAARGGRRLPAVNDLEDLHRPAICGQKGPAGLARARPADGSWPISGLAYALCRGSAPEEGGESVARVRLAPAVTGSANRGCLRVRGTSTGAITSRPVARARGIGWGCPHARDMSHPCTATSRAAVAAMTLAASGQPAISMTWRWWPGLVQASRSWRRDRGTPGRGQPPGHRPRRWGPGQRVRLRCPHRTRPGIRWRA